MSEFTLEADRRFQSHTKSVFTDSAYGGKVLSAVVLISTCLQCPHYVRLQLKLGFVDRHYLYWHVAYDISQGYLNSVPINDQAETPLNFYIVKFA